jgi:hypothetical protein
LYLCMAVQSLLPRSACNPPRRTASSAYDHTTTAILSEPIKYTSKSLDSVQPFCSRTQFEAVRVKCADKDMNLPAEMAADPENRIVHGTPPLAVAAPLLQHTQPLLVDVHHRLLLVLLRLLGLLSYGTERETRFSPRSVTDPTVGKQGVRCGDRRRGETSVRQRLQPPVKPRGAAADGLRSGRRRRGGQAA